MKHFLLCLCLLTLPTWAQGVVGNVISGTRLPAFWVVQVYGTTPKPGDLLDAKREGWQTGKAIATRLQGRLCLVRVTEGKLEVGDVLVPTGLSDPLSKLDLVGTIPPGLEAPRPPVTAFRPRPAARSTIAALGGGTHATPVRASRLNTVAVFTAPHGVHNLDFERRTGQKPFAADSKGVSLKPGEVLNLGTYTDVEGNPLVAYWIEEHQSRYLGLKIDGVLVVLDKPSWYRFRAALEDSVARREHCVQGREPITLACVAGTNGTELEVQVISSTLSDYGWSALSAGGRVVKFTDRGNDNLGGLTRLFHEVGRFWKTE